MSDIFISYSKSDRAKAQILAKALEREGWSVWWDPKIRPGQSFDEVIDRALEAARCVIVLWSKKSVLSDYVKSEAGEGKRRGILIPALIEDDVRIPLDFRRLHASRLTDWRGEESGHLEFDELKDAIAELLGRPPEGEIPEGVYLDPETKLMWTIEDNGKDINWHDANEYAKKLRLGGYSDWRLPTIEELERLSDQKPGGKYKIRELFKLTGMWVWSSTKQGSDSGLGFSFFGFGLGGPDLPSPRGSFNTRALCVRRSDQ